jgi:hypothetical protein
MELAALRLASRIFCYASRVFKHQVALMTSN